MTTVEAAGATEWLPIGQEPHPPGSITHLAVLRSDEHSLLSRADGQLDAASEPAAGLYHHDTRHLSRLRVTLGGLEPLVLDAHETEHGLSAIATNPPLISREGEAVPGQALTLRRRRVLVDVLFEALSVSNYGPRPLTVELRIEFDADFADIFEVRGYERTTPRGAITVERELSRVCFRYAGLDGVQRRTVIRFAIPPHRLSDRVAVFRLRLEPRQTAMVELDVSTATLPGDRRLADAANEVRRRQRAWLEGMTRIETDDDAVNDVLRRSLLDVEALQGTHQGMHYLAAGVPWFDTLFGRDSLISGIMLLAFRPELLASALELLAAYQATSHDPARESEPGKIPHELRWGEIANLGEVPFGRYYGSVDATPLFIVAAHEYLLWTGDTERVQGLWPNIEAAYRWCVESAARGPRGFLAYARETAAGLENQGWKDSHDAIVWPSGTFARPPIALVEVQAYLAAALRAYPAMAEALGQRVPDEAWDAAGRLELAFEAAFGHDEHGYCLAVDGEGEAVPTPASNAGHVLWAGAARPERAARVGEMLLEHDMFSGWGVRTLGSSIAGFNPLGYHTGSVWPHDNALILAGLRNYGLDDHAMELADALLEAALAFPQHRLPELFSGDSREYRAVPTPYPVASRPQAWAAAAIPYLMTTMLGLRPGAPDQLTIARPLLPRAMDEVRIRNLRVGRGAVDLTFRRGAGTVAVEVGRITGPVQVTFKA
ncbi:MAG: amylo-alpha-1,6-glucosidase [Dehalococcoidia bacterium]|nr:amylo-alpha-1,6-glucosidase [Dehalococcoidia bacterium]